MGSLIKEYEVKKMGETVGDEIKMEITIGVFAGVLHKEGKLLLQRRKEEESIIPGKSFKGKYELPGGGLEPEEKEQLFNTLVLKGVLEERRGLLTDRIVSDISNDAPELEILPEVKVLWEALQRELKEEQPQIEISEGIERIDWEGIYRAVLVQRKTKEIDIALGIPVLPSQWKWREAPGKDDIIWVSPDELKKLGDRLPSGWGKRTCRMALWALSFSANQKYRESARKYLSEIHNQMSVSFPRERATYSII